MCQQSWLIEPRSLLDSGRYSEIVRSISQLSVGADIFNGPVSVSKLDPKQAFVQRPCWLWDHVDEAPVVHTSQHDFLLL